jgi:hypothetical protein
MMSMLLSTISASIMVLTGLLMTIGAAAKLADAGGFARDVAAYRLLPDWLASPASRALAIAEAAVGIALLVLPQWSVSRLCATLLLTMFAMAVAINLWRGRRDINCGCTIGAKAMIGWGIVIRNAALTGGLLLPTIPLPSVLRISSIAAGLTLLLLLLAYESLNMRRHAA